MTEQELRSLSMEELIALFQEHREKNPIVSMKAVQTMRSQPEARVG